MCLTVCLASAAPQPVVPWDQQRPAFNAGPLDRFEEGLRRRFSLLHVVSLGAHTGCACGFLRDGATDDLEVQSSREALLTYVAAARQHGPVEIYVCWNGDPDPVDLPQIELTAAELLDREDWLEEGRFTIVRSAAV